MTRERTALVTGANRGIGLEVCRQLAGRGIGVILTTWDAALGRRASEKLAAEGLRVRVEQLDVADERSIGKCAARLSRASIHVDILVNNAGIYPKGRLLTLSTAVLEEALRANFYGAFWTCRAFVPGMVRAGYGRVVNVSSGYGSFGENLEGPAPYSLSKALLNALTFKLATEVRGKGNIKVNAVCPGWVRTRMGGPGADLSVEEGADTVVWLATLPASGPSGSLFRDRRVIPW
jgi:NAD(P)-dependent dehydrogenase (short-subunit alcohol dehydrogenase family)